MPQCGGGRGLTISHTYEVFLKADGKGEFRHVGALGAADSEMALMLARECYCRRGEGEQIWVVRRDDIAVSDSTVTEPNRHKSHRHNDGKRVAEHRRELREGA